MHRIGRTRCEPTTCETANPASRLGSHVALPVVLFSTSQLVLSSQITPSTPSTPIHPRPSSPRSPASSPRPSSPPLRGTSPKAWAHARPPPSLLLWANGPEAQKARPPAVSSLLSRRVSAQLRGPRGQRDGKPRGAEAEGGLCVVCCALWSNAGDCPSISLSLTHSLTRTHIHPPPPKQSLGATCLDRHIVTAARSRASLAPQFFRLGRTIDCLSVRPRATYFT